MSLAQSIRSTLFIGSMTIAAAGGATAFAASTTLSGSVFTSTPGTLVQQSFFDVRSATLTGLSTGDAVGNASTADGQLLAPTGIFILTAGARSGGGVGTGGQSNAQAHCDTSQTYVITSATLPPGTLVPVTIGWALDGHAYAAGNLTYYLSTSSGEVDGRVQVNVNGATVMNKTGVYRRSYSTSGGSDFVSGTLNMLGDFGVITANVGVGQTVQIGMDMTASAVTAAVLSSTTGGDAEIAMLWGVSVTGADAAAVLQSSPGEAAPSAANATPANAALARPPRPAGSLDCLAFSTQPESLSLCDSGDASFSVVATGTGPFTYQWRRNGVAIFSASNPTAATSTLSINNASGADAGAYDCVVSNPCGGTPSHAATLTVLAANDPTCGGPTCDPDVNQDGNVDQGDIDYLIDVVAGAPNPTGIDPDFNQDGNVDQGDIDALINVVAGGECP
ncbi:MAG: immunoglobulin domain-containing protein [Phycisphaerales bacterium]